MKLFFMIVTFIVLASAFVFAGDLVIPFNQEFNLKRNCINKK